MCPACHSYDYDRHILVCDLYMTGVQKVKETIQSGVCEELVSIISIDLYQITRSLPH